MEHVYATFTDKFVGLALPSRHNVLDATKNVHKVPSIVVDRFCGLKVLRSLLIVSFSIPLSVQRSIERVIEKEPIWSERRTLRQHSFRSPWMFIVRLSEVFRGHPPHCETGAASKLLFVCRRSKIKTAVLDTNKNVKQALRKRFMLWWVKLLLLETNGAKFQTRFS